MLRRLLLASVVVGLAVQAVASGFKVRVIAQVPNGAPILPEAKQLPLAAFLEPDERLQMSRAMAVDAGGAVYLNFVRVHPAGWKEIPAEEIFEMDQGRKPASADELAEWRKERFDANRPTTDNAKKEEWKKYREGSRRMHPGFAPQESRRPLSVRMDADGKILGVTEVPAVASKSGLAEAKEISGEELTWFRKNVALPELADKRETIQWREGSQRKSAERNAEFTEGLKLGEDKQGDAVYLMTISMPFLRPHFHGTSDFLARIYVVDKTKRVLQVEAAYPNIRMHSKTHDLYELYQGTYEGLMPALGEPEVKPLAVRVWSNP